MVYPNAVLVMGSLPSSFGHAMIDLPKGVSMKVRNYKIEGI